MTPSIGSPTSPGPALRAALVLAGLVVPQVFLFGPSLAGTKILLPLDILAQPGFYLPATPEYSGIQPHDFVLADQVVLFEFERRFATTEFRAGRLPLWNPSIYLGAPFVVWEKYSPFNIIYYVFPAPPTLAWIQLLKSVVAGAGAYLFFRRTLRVGFWPAVIGGWCFPLTGFFTLWQGYPLSSVTAWLPSMLLATDRVVRRPLSWGGPVVAVLTCLVLITRIDVGGQSLLATGLYALWCLWDEYGRPRHFRRAFGAGLAVTVAWAFGFLLSAPYLFPLAEYTRSGDRILRRGAGQEDRPPGGLHALPQIVLPEIYGTTQRGSVLLGRGNLLESAAATYCGLLVTLLLAPLAWCSARHRSINRFWALLSVIALAWVLNVPGLVHLLRIPGLNLLSHNRFVFAASFAFLALAVVGLEVLWQGSLARRWWFALPVVTIVLLGVWCWDRSTALPEPLATELERALRARRALPNIPDLAALEMARAGYVRSQTLGVVLCGLALGGWLLIWFGATRTWFGPALSVLVLGELLWFAWGRNPQCDPAWYYPRLPVLEQLAEAAPGRVLGFHCLLANLAMSHGLHDVRGYDCIDPQPVIELLDLTRDRSNIPPRYARAQNFIPQAHVASGKIHLPPIVNMLGVRYLIFRAKPSPDLETLLAGADYWVVENTDALPRVFVPRRVERAPAPEHLLPLLASPRFDPREVAYVDGLVSLPDRCRGAATVRDQTPTVVEITVDMDTPGLVVLSDLWYPGWRAYIEGESVPILRTNHALRGIVVPAGRSAIICRYEPLTFAWGVKGLCAGIVGLWAWGMAAWWSGRRARQKKTV